MNSYKINNDGVLRSQSSGVTREERRRKTKNRRRRRKFFDRALIRT
ncbi:MAG: hypothetical protein F6K17_20490 [Okeania sp. SIO3C4]|nr:hypothetical protein [Okeania sp. SIO3B3]NER04806.1 hypothetical protein [Okeania sp. SIO3C4]